MSATNTDNKALASASPDYLKWLIGSDNLSVDQEETTVTNLYAESDLTEARHHNPLASRLLSTLDTDLYRNVQLNENTDAVNQTDGKIKDLPDQKLVEKQFEQFLEQFITLFDEQGQGQGKEFATLYGNVVATQVAISNAKTPEELKQALASQEKAEAKLKEFMETNYPELNTLIVKRMGYGSIVGLINGILANDKAYVDDKRTEVGLEPIVKLLEEKIQLPYSGEGALAASVDKYGKLPEVKPEATFIEFTLADGSKVTFDGAEASQAANAFAKVYNNSGTFRETMHQLAQQQDGIYSFHMYDRGPFENNTIEQAFNTPGTQEGFRANGVFINSPSTIKELNDQYSLIQTMIHEVGHDLHENDATSKDGIPDVGKPHSREQSAFIGSIVNEMENNGVNTNIDIDDGDYSHNVSIFGAHSEKTNGMKPTSQDEFDQWKQVYEKIHKAINQGDYRTATGLMASIPPDAKIEFEIKEPQYNSVSKISYSARDLITQELLLEADSDDWLNTDKGEAKTAEEKQHLANFFKYINAVDSTFEATIDQAFAALHMDQEAEFDMDQIAKSPRDWDPKNKPPHDCCRC